MFQSIYVGILELETNQLQFPKENSLSMSLKGQTFIINSAKQTNAKQSFFDG